MLEKGRITLPKVLRERSGLKKGDRLRVSLEKGEIRIRPAESKPKAVERTKGLLREAEPQLSPEALEETFLAASATWLRREE